MVDFRCTKIQSYALYLLAILIYSKKEKEKGEEKVLSTLLIRLNEFQITCLRDPLCISKIDSVRLRTGTIAKSRLSYGNPEHNFLHTSFKSPEIMRCCVGTNIRLVGIQLTRNFTNVSLCVSFAYVKDYLENRGF